jgi:hypothetical protein
MLEHPSSSSALNPQRRVRLRFPTCCNMVRHIPPGAKVFLPASIERSVWEYFSSKAEQKGIDLSELLTDVLKRDTEINEALE